MSRPRLWERCLVDGCERKPDARGMCHYHYQQARFKREGAPDVEVPRQACSRPGCDGIVMARGLCGAHYQAWRRKGTDDGSECGPPHAEEVG